MPKSTKEPSMPYFLRQVSQLVRYAAEEEPVVHPMIYVGSILFIIAGIPTLYFIEVYKTSPNVINSVIPIIMHNVVSERIIMAACPDI